MPSRVQKQKFHAVLYLLAVVHCRRASISSAVAVVLNPDYISNAYSFKHSCTDVEVNSYSVKLLEFINCYYYNYRKAFVSVSSFASFLLRSSACSTVNSCKRLTAWLALVFTLDILYLSINYVIYLFR